MVYTDPLAVQRLPSPPKSVSLRFKTFLRAESCGERSIITIERFADSFAVGRLNYLVGSS